MYEEIINTITNIAEEVHLLLSQNVKILTLHKTSKK
jgi:hypothetical protein